MRQVMRNCATALTAVLMAVPLAAQNEQAQSSHVVEIRSYNLKTGTRDRFHQLFLREALPMLQRWQVDVVAYGPSLHDTTSYFLMRAFPGIHERQRSEDAFYGSDEWRKGPRDAILADIDSFTTIVIRVDASTLEGLRAMHTEKSSPTDLAALVELNRDYIRSVQSADLRRFEELLADDFLCSLPDGSLLDKARFLQYTASPVSISHLEAHDVNVRLMGDVAIVHARTTFTAADGTAGGGRYTDVWARRNGRWVAVAAHVTRK